MTPTEGRSQQPGMTGAVAAAGMRHSTAVAVMVAVTLMWSIAGVVTRQLQSAHSFEVTFWRSFFTAISLLVILPLWQGPGVFRRMPWGQGAFWFSGVCWGVMFTAFMMALTLEYGVEFIEDDELVEITPKSIRLRKRFLKEHERKRASRDAA